MGNGDVLEGDVELGGAAGEVGSDALRDGFSLGDELGGVKLGDNGLEDFVTDGGKDALIVVGAKILPGVISFCWEALRRATSGIQGKYYTW